MTGIRGQKTEKINERAKQKIRKTQNRERKSRVVSLLSNT